MEIFTFFKGMGIGLAVAVPVGPIGILCIQRSLTRGFRVGFMTGLGAATADAAYGIVAAFGLGAATTILVAESAWFRVIGGAFLVALGIRIILSRADRPVFDEAQEKDPSRLASIGAFSSAFILTLANPATILSFAAIFAALGLAESDSQLAAGSTMVAGVFLGSLLWWLVLSSGAARLRGVAGKRKIRWISRVSGAAIAGIGLWTMSNLL
jgi:threonine/homoserine/homoserine lactone efflux protein